MRILRRIWLGPALIFAAAAFPPTVGFATHPIPTRVLIVGGSAAHGWYDSTGPGYVERGILTFGDATGRAFWIRNRAIPGADAESVAGRYRHWLRTFSPDVVVLAWGVINDLNHRVPLVTFKATLRHQILAAVREHAAVWVITPALARVSVTRYRTLEPRYVAAEVQTARSVGRSKRVAVFDVFSRLRGAYRRGELSLPNVTLGRWHPNTRGHIVASRVLYRLMRAAPPPE